MSIATLFCCPLQEAKIRLYFSVGRWRNAFVATSVFSRESFEASLVESLASMHAGQMRCIGLSPSLGPSPRQKGREAVHHTLHDRHGR